MGATRKNPRVRARLDCLDNLDDIANYTPSKRLSALLAALNVFLLEIGEHEIVDKVHKSIMQLRDWEKPE